MIIRVLHVIGSLGLGGAQVCLKYLVEHAGDCGIESFIYPLRQKPADVAIQGRVVGSSYPNYDPRKVLEIRRLCRRYDIDIIHAHLHKPVIASLLIRPFGRSKVVVHEHGSIALPGIQYALYRLMLRFMHKKADAYITVSHALADYLKNNIGVDSRHITTVYNAIDFQTFTPRQDTRRSMRQQLNLDSRDIAIGFAGRLDYEKGADLAVRSLAYLLRQSPHFMLLLAGAGREQFRLQSLARQLHVDHRVRFLGFRSDISAVMNAFDVGVVPSRQEGFGLSAAELMRMKIPVVCSGVQGLAEIVTNEKTGLIVPGDEPEKIALAIERIISDQPLKMKLVENAHEFSTRFSIEQYVHEIRLIYERVLAAK
jgi:L-malate glycosyltransferase